MLELHTEFPLEEGEEKPEHPNGMGQGIGVRESSFGKVFFHGGNNGDFTCKFDMYDELGMGFAVFN